MNLHRLYSEPLSAVKGWLNDHLDFIASKVTYLLSIVFVCLAAYFLARSLGLS